MRDLALCIILTHPASTQRCEQLRLAPSLTQTPGFCVRNRFFGRIMALDLMTYACV